MRSRDPSVPEDAGIVRAMSQGLCGLGGRLEEAPHDLVEALVLTEARFGERAAARLRRFAEAPPGSVVWSHDLEGDVFRGELLGPWHYDPTPEAADADLVHVRDCAWQKCEDVPETVRASLARGGRNFQRIRAQA